MPESNQPNYRYIMDNLFKLVLQLIQPHLCQFKFFLKQCWMTLLCGRYVIGTLELLVAENYMIVYLNGATSRKKMPTVGWLRKCYQQIDRRWVRNNEWKYFPPVFSSKISRRRYEPIVFQVKEKLKVTDNCPSVVVYPHPAGSHEALHKVWECFLTTKYCLKSELTFNLFCFCSSKFSQKVKYVYSLTDLAELVPMEYVSIPDCIKQ